MAEDDINLVADLAASFGAILAAAWDTIDTIFITLSGDFLLLKFADESFDKILYLDSPHCAVSNTRLISTVDS